MVDIVKEIKDNIEKGEEKIKEVVEKIEEVVEEAVEKLSEGVKDSLDKKKKIKKTKIELKDDDKKESLDAKVKKPKQVKEKTLEEKKKELLEKAKKISEKIDVAKTADLKEQVKLKKRENMLIPLEEYVKAGIYLGTKVVTPNMKPFVYRRRADGLAIFNTDLIDEKLKEGVEYISNFDVKDIILVCKRPAGWKGAQMFSHLTGIRVFTKKYPAGILTNTNLPDFFENKLTIVTDSWLDRNALNDTLRVNKKVLMICDTNNFSKGANQIIIGNNKSQKSLGVIFYLLARGYCKNKKIEADIPDLDWWTGEQE